MSESTKNSNTKFVGPSLLKKINYKLFIIPAIFTLIVITEFTLLKFFNLFPLIYYINFFNLAAILCAFAYYIFDITSITKNSVEEIKEETKLIKFWKIINEASLVYFLKQLFNNFFALLIAVLLTVLVSVHASSVFVAGFALSSLLGFFGVYIASRMNLQVAIQSLKLNEEGARIQCVYGGIISGMLVLIPLFAVSLCSFLVQYSLYFCFGASVAAITTRMTGGVFTKSADIAADMVGKLGYDLPEDDLRNPAVLADNIGDIVGDCIGSQQTFFAVCSFLIAIFSKKITKLALHSTGFFLGLSIMAMVIASAVYFGFFKRNKLITGFSVFGTINIGLLILFNILSRSFFQVSTKYFVVGLLVIVFTSAIVYFFTSPIKKNLQGMDSPISLLANYSSLGAGFNVLYGISMGKMATFFIFLFLIIILIVTLLFSGCLFFGYEFACGVIALSPLIMALDSFGPIADNAGGLVESSKEANNEKAREITDYLDRFGNTSKAITKSLNYIMLIAVILPQILDKIVIFNLLAIIASLMGSILIFLFSSLSINVVLQVAAKIVQSVDEMFKSNPKILKGEVAPEYSKIISELTKLVLSSASIPLYITFSLNILFIVTIFWIFNQSLSQVNITSWTVTHMEMEGFLPSSISLFQLFTIITGVIVGMYMSISGGAWDNCKKFIETGVYGGKKSETHKNAIIGDLVGDPFKDTTGPAMAPLVLTIYCITEITSSLMQKYLFII